MLTTSATILLLLLAVIFAITAKLAEYGKKSAEAEARRIEKIRERGRFLREKKALSKKHSKKK